MLVQRELIEIYRTLPLLGVNVKQKIIRVGNSAAVTIPKKVLTEHGLSIGQEAEVAISPVEEKPVISKEFGSWVDQYIKDNRIALEKLSNVK